MKKIKKFVICTMFIFLCIPSTICAALVNKHEQLAVAEIPGSDYGDVGLNGFGNSFIIPSPGNATSYYSTMSSYFTNLTDNFPYNDLGSCGFVALSMMLSYFENVLHLDVIDDVYKNPIVEYENIDGWSDVVSRGVKYARHEEESKSYEGSFIEYVNEKKDEYFDLLLMYNFNEPRYEDENFSFQYSINEGDLASLVSNMYGGMFTIEYYHPYPGGEITSNMESLIEYSTANTSMFHEEIVEIIQEENLPVWVFLANEFSYVQNPSTGTVFIDNTSKHAVVAHSYTEDEQGNTDILCHFGYGSNDTSLAYNSEIYNYKYIKGYAVIRPTQVSDACERCYKINNLYYCCCGNHIHDLDYDYYNSAKHLISCICGLKYLENHTGEGCCENSGGGGFDPITPPSIIPGIM